MTLQLVVVGVVGYVTKTVDSFLEEQTHKDNVLKQIMFTRDPVTTVVSQTLVVVPIAKVVARLQYRPHEDSVITLVTLMPIVNRQVLREQR